MQHQARALILAVLLICPLTRAAAQQEPAENPYLQVGILELDDFRKLVQNRNGNVLVMNFWATWCAPCKKEFPDLVRFAKSTEGRPVEMVAVSVDYPDEIEGKIVPFLRRVNVNFPVFVRDVEDDQDFIIAVNPDWNGALPATAIYDAEGRQVKFIPGTVTQEQLMSELARFQQADSPQ